ncbi:MAG: hypothetical protein ACR2OJ_13545 [Hyphomicrobiales bacterium]
MPGTRFGRTTIGVALIIGGALGFLPILGFWMIPLGLFFLSVDFPTVRRWRRKATLVGGSWMKRKAPGVWDKYVSLVGTHMPVGSDRNKNIHE